MYYILPLLTYILAFLYMPSVLHNYCCLDSKNPYQENVKLKRSSVFCYAMLCYAKILTCIPITYLSPFPQQRDQAFITTTLLLGPS